MSLLYNYLFRKADVDLFVFRYTVYIPLLNPEVLNKEMAIISAQIVEDNG